MRTKKSYRKWRYKPLWLCFPLLFICLFSSAQQPGNISGKITDNKGGILPGASIKIAQRNLTVVTSANGTFSIQVPAGTYTIEASFISFVSQKKINVQVKSGATTTVNFSLSENANDLNDVVVTALGIKREEKSLGYSTTVVKGEELTEALSNNWTEALSGKVAGLNIVRSNGGPGGSNKIILRGENNLTGGSDALIVVDGVVINGGSGRTTGGSGAYLDESAVDYGNGINDINPEDIENVTVLKGPGAAALYGSRGANGAIIITTKAGKSKDKGIGISVNSNSTFETINRVPSLQYEYGQGDDGVEYYSWGASADGSSTRSTTKAFGPKFKGQLFYQYDPITHAQGATRTPWIAYENAGMNDYFVTGRTFTNSATIDGGTDKTNSRFSVTNANNKWIMPNTGYERTSVAMSVNSKPTKNLQINTKINYTNKFSANLPAGGYNNQTVMYGYIFWQPSADINWLKDYWMPGKTSITQSTPMASGPDNPYLIAYEMLNGSSRNTITGNVSVNYDIAKGLSAMVRTSLDFSSDQRSQQRPYDTEKFPKGMFRTQDIFSQEINSDFLIKYNKKLNKDFDFSISAGGSMLVNNYKRNEVRADSLLYPNVYTTANAAGPLVTFPYKSKYSTSSVYGLITTGYKNFAYLDVTLRNDWTSLLATPTSSDNISFFYPSINGSLILSEILKFPKAVNYAKFRASYASVGSGEFTPYRTSFTYNSSPLYSGGGLYNPTTLANSNLKPLVTSSFELGTEWKFFNNRLGIDIAVYQGKTKDQILTSTVDRASGMSAILVNAGAVSNQGVELSLTGSPYKSKTGLSWTINTTFSSNKNRIDYLTEGLDQLVLQTGPGSNGAIIAKPGGSMGDLFGRGYQRSPEGAIIYENGFPTISDELLYLGNTTPNLKGSIQNRFSYKQFSLSFLFDAQYGSVAYSLTQGKMAVQGKTTSTLPGRYNGIVGDGVVRNADGSFSPNTVIAEDLSSYYDAHFGTNNVEGSTFSTDFIKLREARLDYAFSAKQLKKVGLQKAVIGVYGRDLFMWTKWPGFDPEFGTLSGSEINRGFEIGQFPSTRSLGVNLTLSF